IVNVNPKPVVYAGPDVSVCENHTVTLDAGTGFDNYLWSNGVPQQVITIDSTGVGIGTIIYSVTVTLDGCAAMDEVVVEFMPCPGLNELAGDPIDINIFPNPNEGRFTVSIKGFEQDVDLLILNNIGQVVVNERLNNSSPSAFSRDYDLSHFTPGMYFLRFSDGDIVRTKKVIIR
ncbi:MAG TPA: T9SS type A sorting domain-containing protein, partial [Bacteroidales bacterium]|nr:T9SS type A sorting domain-containing protein [Bacteroidales bacterium]